MLIRLKDFSSITRMILECALGIKVEGPTQPTAVKSLAYGHFVSCPLCVM